MFKETLIDIKNQVNPLYNLSKVINTDSNKKIKFGSTLHKESYNTKKKH